MSAQDHTQRPRTRVLPPAPYALAILAGWWLDRQVLSLALGDGAISRPLGGLFVLAGLALMAWTMLTFWRHRTTVNPYAGASTLCTEGPFRFSRNPIYLGDWLILLGAALWLNTAWPLVFAPLVWALLRYGVIRHEEAHLEAKFGDAYRTYTTQVRRWF